MINVQCCCVVCKYNASSSELICCPSFSRRIRGFGSLLILSYNSAVSSLITLIGSSLRDGFTRTILTDFCSLFVYSSTAGANCLWESEIQTIWSIGKWRMKNASKANSPQGKEWRMVQKNKWKTRILHCIVW